MLDVEVCFFYLKFSSEKVDANCSLPHLYFFGFSGHR